MFKPNQAKPEIIFFRPGSRGLRRDLNFLKLKTVLEVMKIFFLHDSWFQNFISI